MLYFHSIEKLLGLQGACVIKIENIEEKTILHCELKRKTHKGPCCGTATDKIHDYRRQVIKDIPAYTILLISAELIGSRKSF